MHLTVQGGCGKTSHRGKGEKFVTLPWLILPEKGEAGKVTRLRLCPRPGPARDTVKNDSPSFAVQGVSEQLTSASHPLQVDTLWVGRTDTIPRHPASPRNLWRSSYIPGASATPPLRISTFANCLLQEIPFAIPEPLLSDCELVHTGVRTGICAQTYIYTNYTST